jgi:tetratricopeptide (TPR) repeat protein
MFHWIQRIKDHVQEIISLVGLITGFGMAVTGKSPAPWPQTTAVLIIIVSTLFLWGQWWPRISRQSSLLLLDTANIQISWLKSLFDPFRRSSRRSYALSLTHRRVEGAILLGLTLGALVLSSFRLSAVAVEVFPSTLPIPMTCVGDGSPQALRIVIAEFNKVGSSPLLEDRLFDLLTEHSKWMGRVHVCRTDTVIKNQSEAIKLGKEAQAAIVVWGRSDPALYEVNLEVAEWDLRNVNFRSFPTPEAMTPEFQLREPLQTSFLAEFILSDLFFLHGETIAARELLEAALRSAHDEGLDQEPENEENFAVAYFQLGYFYDESTSSSPDLNLAIENYSRSIAIDDTFYGAYLSRGQAYQRNGQAGLAIADYETCASLAKESKPSLAAAALTNLAWVYVESDRPLAEDYFAQAIVLDPVRGYAQRGLARSGNWQQTTLAINDFKKALAIDDTQPRLYDFLGRALLLDNQPEEAIRTYQKAIEVAHWQPGDKDTLIDNLHAMGEDPTPNHAVATIINSLESANLP